MTSAMRLCAVSVDLDEIPSYHAIHGLPAPLGPSRNAVYDVALARLESWAATLELPLTLFSIGADMARDENAARLRALASKGHEIGNHTLDHRYDLVRLDPAEMRRQVAVGRDVLAGATGVRPTGFRAPGYTVTDELLAMVKDTGHSYDASVFPCPAYWLAKAGALSAIALRGRKSRSIVDHPRVLGAPIEPYRMGLPYTRRGEGLTEVPVQVTPRARLPFIGTSLTLAPDAVGRSLTRAVATCETVNLELHGIDVLDDGDGLHALVGHQPDVRVAKGDKLRRLTASLELLRDAGFSFVTMREIAGRVPGAHGR
jgi:hypothetical protein